MKSPCGYKISLPDAANIGGIRFIKITKILRCSGPAEGFPRGVETGVILGCFAREAEAGRLLCCAGKSGLPGLLALQPSSTQAEYRMRNGLDLRQQAISRAIYERRVERRFASGLQCRRTARNGQRRTELLSDRVIGGSSGGGYLHQGTGYIAAPQLSLSSYTVTTQRILVEDEGGGEWHFEAGKRFAIRPGNRVAAKFVGSKRGGLTPATMRNLDTGEDWHRKSASICPIIDG
jgi:hypothetical protein